jgi:hypothetical protein
MLAAVRAAIPRTKSPVAPLAGTQKRSPEANQRAAITGTYLPEAHVPLHRVLVHELYAVVVQTDSVV